MGIQREFKAHKLSDYSVGWYFNCRHWKLPQNVQQLKVRKRCFWPISRFQPRIGLKWRRMASSTTELTYNLADIQI